MSFRSRLRTAIALPAGERGLAVRALIALLRARFDIHWMSLPRLRRSVGASAATPPDAQRALAVKRAVERAARTMPSSTCFAQSVAAARLLRAEGLPGELTIGVARTGSRGGIDAHAWVRSGDVVVTGDGDLDAYTALTRLGQVS